MERICDMNTKVEGAAIQLICGDLSKRTLQSYHGYNYDNDLDGTFNNIVLAEEKDMSVQRSQIERESGRFSEESCSLMEEVAKDNRKAKSFDERLIDLANFKKIYGHCNPPSRNSSLGRWCKRIRYNYKCQAEGKSVKWGRKKPLTAEQIKQLENIGFQWSVLAKSFEQRLNELAKFKEIHGHCNVPRSYSTLGVWCNNVRSGYRQLQRGKVQSSGSNLTQERIKSLQEIGFQFRPLHLPKITFEQRLKELVKFKEIHGHCNVPTRYSKTNLANWCKNIRAGYNQLLRGDTQTSGMKLTAERVMALKEIGFPFFPRS